MKIQLCFFGNLRLRFFKLLRAQLKTTWKVSIQYHHKLMFKVFINHYYQQIHMRYVSYDYNFKDILIQLRGL